MGIAGWLVASLQHSLGQWLGSRDHRQPVGPSLVGVIVLDALSEGVLHVNAAGLEVVGVHGHKLFQSVVGRKLIFGFFPGANVDLHRRGLAWREISV